MSDERLEIVNGPSKFDLMVSLFEGNPHPGRHTVDFKLRGHGIVDFSAIPGIGVAITGISQEDGSGESWNFEGWVTFANLGCVRGYYSSKTRKGWVLFLEDRAKRGAGFRKIIDEIEQIRADLDRG